MALYRARDEFPYRPFLVNKTGHVISESHFGGNVPGKSLVGDSALLEQQLAKTCTMCRAPTVLEFLDKNGACPDCDGRSEANGADPRRNK